VYLPRVHQLARQHGNHHADYIGERQITSPDSWRTSVTSLLCSRLFSATSPPHLCHKRTLDLDQSADRDVCPPAARAHATLLLTTHSSSLPILHARWGSRVSEHNVQRRALRQRCPKRQRNKRAFHHRGGQPRGATQVKLLMTRRIPVAQPPLHHDRCCTCGPGCRPS
jgi:hypothetical protein